MLTNEIVQKITIKDFKVLEFSEYYIFFLHKKTNKEMAVFLELSENKVGISVVHNYLRYENLTGKVIQIKLLEELKESLVKNLQLNKKLRLPIITGSLKIEISDASFEKTKKEIEDLSFYQTYKECHEGFSDTPFEFLMIMLIFFLFLLLFVLFVFFTERSILILSIESLIIISFSSLFIRYGILAFKQFQKAKMVFQVINKKNK